MAQWPTNPDYTPLKQINKGNEIDAGDGLIADDVNKIVKNAVAYVKANPTESGTVDLTKLKVGDTTYNIPQGGGGGDDKLDKQTGNDIVYVNGSTGTPTKIGYAANSAVINSIVRRTNKGAVFATNIGNPFNSITNLNNNIGKRVVYVGGDVTLTSQNKITINSNVYDVDFNGATITVNQGAFALVVNTKDGLLKGHSYCVIRNLNLVVNLAPYSTNTALTGYNILDTFGGMENVRVTINSSATSAGSVDLTLRGIANVDHAVNTKVDLDCTTTKVTSICYSYCNYLLWCRTDGDNDYSFAECNYLVNCLSMTKITTKNREKSASFLNCDILSNCSYYIVIVDPDDPSHNPARIAILKYTSTVGLSPLDSIQEVNDGKTKAYVKPANNRGITAAIDVDTDANDNTIVRRLSSGQIRAKAAVNNPDCMIKEQFRVLTQAQYDALTTKDSNTFYFITE